MPFAKGLKKRKIDPFSASLPSSLDNLDFKKFFFFFLTFLSIQRTIDREAEIGKERRQKYRASVDNQQGPTGQHGKLDSIFCNNL